MDTVSVASWPWTEAVENGIVRFFPESVKELDFDASKMGPWFLRVEVTQRSAEPVSRFRFSCCGL